MTQIDLDQLARLIGIFLVVFGIILCIILFFFFPRQTTMENLRTAHRLAGPVVMVTTRASEPVKHPAPTKILFMEISAYSPAEAETDGDPMTTASGKRVRVGGIAADLRVLPLGSRVIIPNYNGGRPCTVTDTGGAIHGNKLDVFLWSAHEAIHWGRRHNVRVKVLYIPKEKS